MDKTKAISTEDILLTLCNSVVNVLTTATGRDVSYSPMVQKISRTCLRPDIGCFVLFTGGFSGLVVLNFSAESALEIYENYMTSMGLPKEELATQFTSDDVSNVLGELMNQIVGAFTGKVGKELHTSINQNQPKMLTINQQVTISIGTSLDRPQSRRVAFTTAQHSTFYLELSMDKTEFIKVADFEAEEVDPDAIIDNAAAAAAEAAAAPPEDDLDDDDFMSSLGL